MREFAEKGEAWTLMKEVESAGERIQSVYGILSAPAVVGGTGQMNTEFEVFARHSYVSQSAPGFLQSGSGIEYIILFLTGQYNVYITWWCDAFLLLGQRAKEFLKNVANHSSY